LLTRTKEYVHELDQQRERARVKAAAENRARYLLEHGIADAPIRKVDGKRLRVTNCYDCRKYIDNVTLGECTRCGWIVCTCGACGCGYVP
jgi:hypothetical protein